MCDSKLLDFIPTRASLLKNNAGTNYTATVFTDRKIKKTGDLPQRNTMTTKVFPADKNHKSQNDIEFDMKKARHEVMTFGLNGFQSKNKAKAKLAIAVKLGAIAPKNKYVNYKELLENKRNHKERQEQANKLLQMGKNQTGAAAVRCKSKSKSKRKNSKKDLGEIGKHYGVAKPNIVIKKNFKK